MRITENRRREGAVSAHLAALFLPSRPIPKGTTVTQDRPSIEQVMMAVASTMALRSTCSRLNVGAVIAKDGRIVSTGYNGAPAGMPHCPPKGEHTQPCTDAIHAETNAIVYAARAGISTNGATLYCTHAPCAPCARLVASAGITKVIYGDTYRSEQGLAELKFLDIQITYLPLEHQLP